MAIRREQPPMSAQAINSIAATAVRWIQLERAAVPARSVWAVEASRVDVSRAVVRLVLTDAAKRGPWLAPAWVTADRLDSAQVNADSRRGSQREQRACYTWQSNRHECSRQCRTHTGVAK